MADVVSRRAEPSTLADLHLPPTFVAEHAVRVLAYQGAMTPAEIARRWRVDDTIAVEVVESLKSEGLVELDSAQKTFERTGRVRLTAAGHERVTAARRRTWYAGALPVSLSDFSSRVDLALPVPPAPAGAESALAALAIDPVQAAEISQAAHAGATLAVRGAAYDEQIPIVHAIAGALEGVVSLPFALYAAGAVMRVVDSRFHHTSEAPGEDIPAVDILRSRESHAQWATVARPVVTIAGGVQSVDVLPAYDDEARFYVAPIPFAACRGLLAVLDSDTNPAGLADLARLWLVPGRQHTGVLLLRSGERIEIPWRASTVLFCTGAPALPGALGAGITYSIDVAALTGDALKLFLSLRLTDRNTFPPDAIGALGSLIERCGVATRTGAAGVARYLRERAAYQEDFSLTPQTLERAIDFAAAHAEPAPKLRAVS